MTLNDEVWFCQRLQLTCAILRKAEAMSCQWQLALHLLAWRVGRTIQRLNQMNAVALQRR